MEPITGSSELDQDVMSSSTRHQDDDERRRCNDPVEKDKWTEFDSKSSETKAITSSSIKQSSDEQQQQQSNQTNYPLDSVTIAVIKPSSSVQVTRDPLTDFPLPSSPSSSSSSSLKSPSQSSSLVFPSAGEKSLMQNQSKILHSKQQQQQQQQTINKNTTTAANTSSNNLTIPIIKTSSSNKSFKNGQILVTLLPLNESLSWITAAKFKPNLIPEELMHPSLTLTIEEYVQAMSILVNDHRFTLYNMMYKRIVFIWTMIAFVFLISMLFSGSKGLSLMAAGLIWLITNSVGIFVCMWFKFKMIRGLEDCIKMVNSILIKHHILLGIDDKGHFSCHKINLIFIYFDTSHCLKYLSEMICQAKDNQVVIINGSTTSATTTTNNNGTNQQQQQQQQQQRIHQMDITRIEIDEDQIIITSSCDSSTNHHPESSGSRKIEKTSQSQANGLILKYSQRYIKLMSRGRLDLKFMLHLDSPAAPSTDSTWTSLPPRHCVTGSRCLCQYIEEHLKYKPLTRVTIRDICC